MKKIPIEPGRAVLSVAGRDSGRRFVALRIEGEYAYIADGDLRKVENPKKKKRMHLRAKPEIFSDVAVLLEKGMLPTNAQLRKCIGKCCEGADAPQAAASEPTDR